MKLMNLYFALGFTVSMSVALVACNKGSDNNPPPAPPPVVGPQPPVLFPTVRVGPAGPARVKEYAHISCVSTATDLSGRSGLLDVQPYSFEYPWDTSKVETINIPQRYSSTFGNVTLKVQPNTMDSNSYISAHGSMEITVSGSGSVATIVRSPLNSNIKLEIDDEYRETNFTVDCNIVEAFVPAQVKTAYTCYRGNVQSAPNNPVATTIKDFRINSKPQSFDGNNSLKLEVDKSRDIERVALTVAQNENRKIKVSVPFGHEFVAQIGLSTFGNIAVDCQANNINATQQAEKK